MAASGDLSAQAVVALAVDNGLTGWQFLLALSAIMIVLGMVLDAVAVLLIVRPRGAVALDALAVRQAPEHEETR